MRFKNCTEIRHTGDTSEGYNRIIFSFCDKSKPSQYWKLDFKNEDLKTLLREDLFRIFERHNLYPE